MRSSLSLRSHGFLSSWWDYISMRTLLQFPCGLVKLAFSCFNTHFCFLNCNEHVLEIPHRRYPHQLSKHSALGKHSHSSCTFSLLGIQILKPPIFDGSIHISPHLLFNITPMTHPIWIQKWGFSLPRKDHGGMGKISNSKSLDKSVSSPSQQSPHER